jgi:16S rRNA (cytosine967-C5)-methyltransferase
MKISPARTAAYEALLRVERDRAFTSSVLPAVEEGLSESDSGLCHEIVMGTLRRQMLLDAMVAAKTLGKRLDAEVRVILRMSAYQLLFLDRIPDHAVVNDAVNLTVKARKSSARGLVNAVLRGLSRDSVKLEFADDLERVSVETSHPRWLLERWTGQFGLGEAEAIARADNETPGVFWRGTARNPSGVQAADHRELRRAAERGEIYFQDRGSQMVASAVPVSAGSKILDVCAAPGSKSTMMAVGHSADGTLIVGGDVHSSRVSQLASSVRLQGASAVAVVRYDAAASLPFADGTFDAVLLDAPCSGTGTIRHNPELRYFISRDDILDLSRKQLSLLENASKVLRRGGTLVYSTCSLEQEENEGVCRRFSEAHPDMKLKSPAVPSEFLTEDGFARTFPNRDGTDGFFVATFEKL